jgi:hypothetical protein
LRSVFLGHLQPFLKVVLGLLEPVELLLEVGYAAFFLEDRGQGLMVVPGPGLGQYGLYFLQALVVVVVVKDAPKGCRIASGVRRSGSSNQDIATCFFAYNEKGYTISK